MQYLVAIIPLAGLGIAVWLRPNHKAAGASVLLGFGTASLLLAQLFSNALDSAYTVEIAADAGKHSLALREIPFEGMEIALRRKDGKPISKLFPTREAALVYDWKVNGQASTGYTEYDSDENLISLFLIPRSHVTATLQLEYEVKPQSAAALREVEVVVHHDSVSRHMLQDHGMTILRIAGIVFSAFGLLLGILSARAGMNAKR